MGTKGQSDIKINPDGASFRMMFCMAKSEKSYHLLFAGMARSYTGDGM